MVRVNQLGIPDSYGNIFAEDIPVNMTYPVWTGSSWSSMPDRYQLSFVEPVPDNSVRKEEILARLTQLDLDSVRPLRAVATNTATSFDLVKLASIDSEAERLREELRSL